MKKAAIILAFTLALSTSAVIGAQLLLLASADFIPSPPSFSPAIYIRSDGSIDPSTSPIKPVGDIYTLTNNILGFTIVPERGNITIDGGGYTLQGNGSSRAGIFLYYGNNITVRNMKIENFYSGVVIGSENNIVSENIITDTTYGIWISPYITADGPWFKGGDSSISGNTVKDNTYGITIQESSKNVLRNNQMSNNEVNFWVDGSLQMANFIHDIDASNTVNGKPIYYWVNERDKTVPSDAGYVALVNSKNITVQGLTLSHNREGVLLISTINSTISRNHITNNVYGIRSYGTYSPDIPCSNISIIENKITENSEVGILLWEETNSVNVVRNQITNNHVAGIESFRLKNSNIMGNKITENKDSGIALWGYGGHGNVISENHVANNGNGITIGSSENNIIYRNNLVNNTQNVIIEGSPSLLSNVWDRDNEGNYWSNYNGTDSDGDGIGNTPYVIDEYNQDNYPLMEPTTVIPKFPSWIILPLLLTAILLIIICKQKLLKTSH